MYIDRRTLLGATASVGLAGASACQAGTAPAGMSMRLALLGQQGHGKTTLAAAIVKTQADAGLAEAASTDAFRTGSRGTS